MKCFKKLSAIVLAGLLILGLLAGCQSDKTGQSSPSTEDLFVDDPFEENAASNDLGWLSHGVANPILDESGARKAYEYDGGQFELEYRVSASGRAKNVGFLLFLDGIPQPYQVNGEGNMDYMHMLELEEDEQEYQFSFVFSPVTGSTGETLELKICSLTNAQFQPDMVTSSSYGFYHDKLESSIKMSFLADANIDDNTSDQTVTALSSVTVNSTAITDNFVSNYLNSGFTMDGQSAEELLESSVFHFIDYDGKTVYDNLDVTGKDTVHITYQVVGIPGTAYRVTLFADHQPMTDGEENTWNIVLSKGKVATLEADIDVSALDDLTTFYVYACPIDSGSASNAVGNKTSSILLYKDIQTNTDADQSEATEQDNKTEPLAADDLLSSTDIQKVYYGSAGTLLVSTFDTLYLYHAETKTILAQRSVDQQLQATFYPAGDGICAIGTLSTSGGGGFVSSSSVSTMCIFYNNDLQEVESINLNKLGTGVDNIQCVAVSSDGNAVAYSTMDKLYCYDRTSDTLDVVLDFSYERMEANGGLSAISALAFSTSGDKLLFCGRTFSLPITDGQYSYCTYGSISLNGSNLQNLSFQGFDAGSLSCSAGGYLFFEENMNAVSGKLAIVDSRNMSQQIYSLNTVSEGMSGLYASQNGEYYATVKMDSNQATVRIYQRATGKLVKTQTIEDTNAAFFYRTPSIYILDSLDLCVVKLGGFNDTPSKMVVFSL